MGSHSLSAIEVLLSLQVSIVASISLDATGLGISSGVRNMVYLPLNGRALGAERRDRKDVYIWSRSRIIDSCATLSSLIEASRFSRT